LFVFSSDQTFYYFFVFTSSLYKNKTYNKLRHTKTNVENNNNCESMIVSCKISTRVTIIIQPIYFFILLYLYNAWKFSFWGETCSSLYKRYSFTMNLSCVWKCFHWICIYKTTGYQSFLLITRVLQISPFLSRGWWEYERYVYSVAYFQVFINQAYYKSTNKTHCI